MNPARKCYTCDDQCYHNDDGLPSPLEDQLIYHYFLGWCIETCADFAEITETEAEEIICEAHEAITRNGTEPRQGFQNRFNELVNDLVPLTTQTQFNRFFDRAERLQHDIARAALSTVNNSPVVRFIGSSSEALELQSGIFDLRKKAFVQENLHRNKN